MTWKNVKLVEIMEKHRKHGNFGYLTEKSPQGMFEFIETIFYIDINMII